MAKIKAENINELREALQKDVFPFLDFKPEESMIEIKITKKETNQEVNQAYQIKNIYSTQSEVYSEEEHGLLPAAVRIALIEFLWRQDPDKDMMDRLKKLDISVEFPRSSKFSLWR